MSFVHLHTHSQYSLLDATLSLQDIVQKATSYGMPAVALTDHGNLYGAIDFYKLCKEAKIKPILGCELYVAPTSRHEKKRLTPLPTSFHLTLLAKNKQGYQNLCKLSSIGFIEGFYYTPRIDAEALKTHKEGLICLSGCLQSKLAYLIINDQDPLPLIKEYQSLFGDDFYLELQRHAMSPEAIEHDGLHEEAWLYQQYQDYIHKQEKVNKKLLSLATEHGIPLVATNNCHFAERQDWKAHETLINIQSGEPCEIWEEDSAGNKKFRIPNPKRSSFPSHELYMKSPEEMAALFQDIPEAITNTLDIAKKCELSFDFSIKHYPVYVPATLQPGYNEDARKKAVSDLLLTLCQDALPHRYTTEKLAKVAEQYPGQDPMEVVTKRLAYEMGIIASKDMCDYLLIVWDFINWAKKQGIPMGPGRGSGAGSIICYLTGITDIEPLRFNLFFERFINPERISYPDIDVDICMERRGDVINYTIQKYGNINVAQISTFGTMKAKMVIRDVGRTLSIPLAKVNTIAKLIPEELTITIDKALEQDADLKALYENDPEAKKIIDIGRKLEGSIRSVGTHAAGLIISGDPLTEHIPICTAKDSHLFATQYAMKPVEMVGMLKIDFLGLKTLTCIQLCQDAVKAHHATSLATSLDWMNLPLDDPNTFELLNQGKTQGVFQLESGGMQELAKNLHLDKFEEIIAVLSLYRPGPMDMIPSFIARKHKREPIEYDHPWMVPILAETYGIMVYQEQVMQIASTLASYSLGEGDVLRRAMGKKDAKEMAKQRQKFISGATANGIDTEVAGGIFDKMEKFAEYGFNKSHATAYGYLTYVTAFFKAHFPSDWLAALMTCDRDDITKIAKFTHEGRQMGIAILPPDCNESDAHFRATKTGIRYAMNGIKGIGSGVVETIVEERKKGGPYKNLYDFIARLHPLGITKKTYELLVEAGAFDYTVWHRDCLLASIDAMMDSAVRMSRNKTVGIVSLFEELNDDAGYFTKPPKLARLRSKEDLLFKEKELLGFFLSGHPLDAYSELLKRYGTQPLAAAEKMPEGAVFRTAFLIEAVSVRISSKTQKKFAFITISDTVLGQYEIPIWPELYEEKQLHIVENKMVVAVVAKEMRNGEPALSCKWLCDIKQFDETALKASDIAYDKAKFQSGRTPYSGRGKEPYKNLDTKPSARLESLVKDLKSSKMVIDIDLSLLQASHILKLQSILSTAEKGTELIEIRFLAAGKQPPTLFVDQKCTIRRTPEVDSKLRAIPCIVSVS